jgi:hypothetical protein
VETTAQTNNDTCGALSTFDANDEDWTVSPTNAGFFQHQEEGGNPGGYIEGEDTANDVWYYQAPEQFLGDQQCAYGGVLRFDLQHPTTDDPYEDDADVVLESNDITLTYDAATNPAADWTTYGVTLTESVEWLNSETDQPATQQELQDVLSNLTALRIRGEYSNLVSGDISGLDNVLLTDGSPRNSFVVGGFNEERGGSFKFRENFSGARAALAREFPGATLTATNVLSDAFLANVDILILSTGFGGTVQVQPLSADEQQALRDFVETGQCVVLLTDTERFYEDANESLLDPFEMDSAGTTNTAQTIDVPNPGQSAVTSGRFGVINSFEQGFFGSISAVGPFATGLADNSLGTALAQIDSNVLAPGAGRVVATSDITMFVDDRGGQNPGKFPNPTNEDLFLNIIDFCLGAQPPATAVDRKTYLPILAQ